MDKKRNSFQLPKFKINDHDKDGWPQDFGIFLCFGNTSVKIAEDLDGLDAFIDHMRTIRQEIIDTYGDDL